ncbi:MAG TPA: hypothetical protein VNP20_17205 [Nocardioidaceae bacterium]|nr:hypothetical protein [Nocardioidaceae bacterium]
MAVTGEVYGDLRDVDPERAYRRLGQIDSAPDGARLTLVVGALAPNPRVIDVLFNFGHVERLHIAVAGEPHAVRKWVEALRTGDILAGIGRPA